MAVDYAALAKQAETETAQPAGGGQDYAKLAQQAELEANAPAPLSGPVDGQPKVPEPTGQGLMHVGGFATNADEAYDGAKGAVKGLVKTAQNIHANNNPNGHAWDGGPQAPDNFWGNKVNTKPSNPDQQAGYGVETALENVLPGEAAVDMLPNAGRAGKALNAIESKLNSADVSLKHATPALQRVAQQSAAGGGSPAAPMALLNRSQSIEPLRFPEARRIYSNISGLSAQDKIGSTPAMAREVKNLRGAFHEDLAHTADLHGPATKGNYFNDPMDGLRMQYENAMQEYRNSHLLKDGLQKVGKYVVPGGSAIGLGSYLLHRLRSGTGTGE